MRWQSSLCQFNESWELDKLTDVKSGRGYCLELSKEFVMCGCGDGVICLFDPNSLDTSSLSHDHTHLELTHHQLLHWFNVYPVLLYIVNHLLSCSQFRSQSGQCADTIGMGIDCVNKKVYYTCTILLWFCFSWFVIYNDHSLYIWYLKKYHTNWQHKLMSISQCLYMESLCK